MNRDSFFGRLKKRAPIIRTNLRIWCEYWGVFDGIDRINLLLEKQLKKFWIFGFLALTICANC